MYVHKAHWKDRLHEVVFESDTKAGKLFDTVVIASILVSVFVVLIESVAAIRAVYGVQLQGIEWFFTILFTIEYFLRIISIRRPIAYMTSFYGIVDLLSIIPTYLSVFFPGMQGLLVIRVLRLMRLFRVFKLTRYIRGGYVIGNAVKASLPKMTVFLTLVISIIIIAGALIHLVEGGQNGFSSIPMSMYWAVITVTTVGYGDIIPHTAFGKMLASLLVIVGYSIIAVPTGIVSVEMATAAKNTQSCRYCAESHHADDAKYCKRCGNALN